MNERVEIARASANGISRLCKLSRKLITFDFEFQYFTFYNLLTDEGVEGEGGGGIGIVETWNSPYRKVCLCKRAANGESNLKNSCTENAGQGRRHEPFKALPVILGDLPKDTLIFGLLFALWILTG